MPGVRGWRKRKGLQTERTSVFGVHVITEKCGAAGGRPAGRRALTLIPAGEDRPLRRCSSTPGTRRRRRRSGTTGSRRSGPPWPQPRPTAASGTVLNYALLARFSRWHGLRAPWRGRAVVRHGHDAPPVRQHGNAGGLRRRQIIHKVQWTQQRARNVKCPFSVATRRRSRRSTP